MVIFFDFKHTALIFGLLTAQLLQLLMLAKMSAWRPELILSRSVAFRLFDFAKWVLLSSIAAWVFAWGDSIFVANLLTLEELGLFRMASHLVLMGYALVFSPLIPLLYSRLVKYENYGDGSLLQFLTVLSFGVGLVLTALFSVFVPPILYLIETVAWNGLGPIIILASLTQVIPYIFVYAGEFYRAAGIPKIETLQRFGSLLVLGVFFIICSAVTLEDFMEQRLIVTFVTGFIELTFLFVLLKRMPIYSFITLLIAIGVIFMLVFHNVHIYAILIPIPFVLGIAIKHFRKLQFLLN